MFIITANTQYVNKRFSSRKNTSLKNYLGHIETTNKEKTTVTLSQDKTCEVGTNNVEDS